MVHTNNVSTESAHLPLALNLVTLLKQYYTMLNWEMNTTSEPRYRADWGPMFPKLNLANNHTTVAHVTRERLTYQSWTRQLQFWTRRAGLSGERFTPHSFRSGAATDLVAQGMPVEDIKRVGRWNSSVWRRYNRPTGQVLAHRVAEAIEKGAVAYLEPSQSTAP